MAGPSNIAAPSAHAATNDIHALYEFPGGLDSGVDVRIVNYQASTVLYSLAIAPPGTDPVATPLALWWRLWDFEVEPRRPYDVEQFLELPAGWLIFHRAATVGVLATVTGSKKQIA